MTTESLKPAGIGIDAELPAGGFAEQLLNDGEAKIGIVADAIESFGNIGGQGRVGTARDESKVRQ